MTLGDIISEYRKNTGMSMERFAETAGISKAYVSMLERNRTQRGDEPSPSIETYRSVARAIGLDVDELIRKVDGKVSIKDSVSSSPNVVFQEDTITFYPIGTVAAGYNKFALEELTDDPIDIPASYLKGRPKEDYFLLKVTGNSMYPLYHNGDHVLVLRQSTLNRSGEIGVVLYDGEQATLKKIEYVDGENWIKLVPINPEYQEKTIQNIDLEQCRILGIPRVLIREIE